MVVKLMPIYMKPVRLRDAVKQQLAREYGDSDSLSKSMTIKDSRFDKFEAAEKNFEVPVSDAVSDMLDKKPGKDGGQLRKETAGKINWNKPRGNSDGVETFRVTYFKCTVRQ